MKPKEIEINKINFELSRDGKLHVIYIPDQTQLLEAGKEYEIILCNEEG